MDLVAMLSTDVLPYISRIRIETGVTRSLLSSKHVEIIMSRYFLGVLNSKVDAMKLPGQGKVDKLVQAPHVNETENSQVNDNFIHYGA